MDLIVKFPFLDGEVPRSTSYGAISLNSFVKLEHLAILKQTKTSDFHGTVSINPVKTSQQK